MDEEYTKTKEYLRRIKYRKSVDNSSEESEDKYVSHKNYMSEGCAKC